MYENTLRFRHVPITASNPVTKGNESPCGGNSVKKTTCPQTLSMNDETAADHNCLESLKSLEGILETPIHFRNISQLVLFLNSNTEVSAKNYHEFEKSRQTILDNLLSESLMASLNKDNQEITEKLIRDGAIIKMDALQESFREAIVNRDSSQVKWLLSLDTSKTKKEDLMRVLTDALHLANILKLSMIGGLLEQKKHSILKLILELKLKQE